MLVTVWRHGEAGAAPRDEDRELTARGVRTVCEATVEFRQWLSEAQIAPVSEIWYSPLVRTFQTAGLLGKGLGCEIQACEALAPGTNLHKPDTFLPAVAEHVMIVTHQPFVSQVIWHWLDDDRLEPILPGGWATLELTVPTRGGGELVRARTSIF